MPLSPLRSVERPRAAASSKEETARGTEPDRKASGFSLPLWVGPPGKERIR